MMNEKELTGMARLEEAFRRHDRLYLEKYPPSTKQNGVSKRLCAALLAAAVLLCSAFCISAVKDPLTEFSVNIYRELIEIFFDGEISAPNNTEYTLYALPDGYILRSEYRGESEYKRIWEHESGNTIMLLQLPLDAKITLDNEDSLQRTLDINGITVLCFEKHDKRLYYWYTDTYMLSLTVPNSLVEEQCLTLIRSLHAET